MSLLRLRGFVVAGALAATTAFAAAAVPADAAPPPAQGCSDTLVVVEWRDAPNSPAADNGISGGCGAADPNPVDVLQNAGFSPIFEDLGSTVQSVLCAIYLSPGADCKGMPAGAYWSYWVVDPQTQQWEEQPYDTGAATPDSGHPMAHAARTQRVQPGAGSPRIQPGASSPRVQPAGSASAPPIEDWVYQSDHGAGKPDVPPAYPATGTAPSSPTASPSGPTADPTSTDSGAPTTTPSPRLPSVLPSARLPRVRPTTTTAPTGSAPAPRHSQASAHNVPTAPRDQSSGGDAYVAAPPVAATSSGPDLPGAPIPSTWSLSPSGTPPTDLTRAGRASRTAWATGDSAHRVAWSTGLGIAAVALLGVGVVAQLRRRRA
jgi:hypothetical protein